MYTDIRVPYFVRGPGIAAGVSREEPISHVDLSPTIIDIVTGSVPSNWDGRSFKQLLLDQHAIWKEENMIQYVKSYFHVFQNGKVQLVHQV